MQEHSRVVHLLLSSCITRLAFLQCPTYIKIAVLSMNAVFKLVLYFQTDFIGGSDKSACRMAKTFGKAGQGTKYVIPRENVSCRSAYATRRQGRHC